MLCTAGFFLVVAAVPASASAVQGAYPPPTVSLQLSANEACPPAGLTVTGQGFAAGSHVTLTLMSTPVTLATATTNSAGSFSQEVTVPAGTPLGAHHIVATGPSLATPVQTLTLLAQLTLVCPVAAPAAPAPAKPPLAFTGFQARGWLAASLAFILVGSALVFAVRKRRQGRAS